MLELFIAICLTQQVQPCNCGAVGAHGTQTHDNNLTAGLGRMRPVCDDNGVGGQQLAIGQAAPRPIDVQRNGTVNVPRIGNRNAQQAAVGPQYRTDDGDDVAGRSPAKKPQVAVAAPKKANDARVAAGPSGGHGSGTGGGNGQGKVAVKPPKAPNNNAGNVRHQYTQGRINELENELAALRSQLNALLATNKTNVSSVETTGTGGE